MRHAQNTRPHQTTAAIKNNIRATFVVSVAVVGLNGGRNRQHLPACLHDE